MTDADTLAADMARLGARPYSEVGVPMFVIGRDLTAAELPPVSSAASGELADRFAELATALISHDPDPGIANIARLVEVLADRHLLEVDGPRFTSISDGAA